MAPLFSKVDLNKLWHDVQNEESLICAKCGKYLFNISKVIGRKKVAQFFLTHGVYTVDNKEWVSTATVRLKMLVAAFYERTKLVWCHFALCDKELIP